MNLEKHLISLLHQHDCVIVPEFGAFIANCEAARIQAATHTLLPPRKFLVFNSNLTFNDGLLATAVKQDFLCDFDEATRLIHQEVAAWRDELKKGNKLILDGIGVFHINKTGKLEFKPDPDQNFFNQAFGLKPLVVPPVRKRVRKPKPAKVYYHKRVRKPSIRKIRRIAWAAVITIPLIAAGIWSIMRFDALQQFANQHSEIITPFHHQVIEPVQNLFQIQSKEQPSLLNSETSDEFEPGEEISLNESTPAEEAIKESENAEEATLIESETVADEVQPYSYSDCEPSVAGQRAYHIIVGSFEVDFNAGILVNELGKLGWNARTIESAEGKFRVSIASCAVKQQALELLQKVREEQNPAAWLLRI